MKKWYKEPYFDRIIWLIANFEKLNITNDELVFVMVVEYSRRNNLQLTYDYLSKKLNMSLKNVDKIIASLVNKKYLKIDINGANIVFDIDGIFEFDPTKYEISENADIFNTLELVFCRPLSAIELTKTNELIDKYGENKFKDALRTAEAYKKVSMNYIEYILRNEQN